LNSLFIHFRIFQLSIIVIVMIIILPMFLSVEFLLPAAFKNHSNQSYNSVFVEAAHFLELLHVSDCFRILFLLTVQDRARLTGVPVVSAKGQRSRLRLELGLRSAVDERVGRLHIMSALGRHLHFFMNIMSGTMRFKAICLKGRGLAHSVTSLVASTKLINAGPG